jgi:glutamate-1-semialdehyde aminotransferase
MDGKTAMEANKDILPLLQLALLQKGIFLPLKCQLAISTPMTEKEVDTAAQAIDDSMTEFKPYIEQIWPELAGKV